MTGSRTSRRSRSITRFAPVLIINPSLPAKDLKEFIALAKANPGKFSYGSSGAGTAIHLASELFKVTADVDIVHVPYRGNAGVMPDLLAGRIQMLIDGVPPQQEEHRSRRGAGAGGDHAGARADAAERADHDRAGARLRGALLDRDLRSGGDPEADHREARGGDRQDHARSAAWSAKLKDVGTEAVGSTPAELDTFNRDQFALYRKIVQDPRLKLNLQ